MKSQSCPSPLGLDTLIAYWLGELEPEVEARAEEHYLGCAQCSKRLEQLAALAQGMRRLARSGGVDMVANHAFVRRLRKDGRRVREYRVPRNGSVNCTIAPEDDFVVALLEAPLAGVQRVDMIALDRDGKIQSRQQDVPFMRDSGGVVVLTDVDGLRARPAFTLRLRLLAVDASGERTLGEYTFNHSPYRSNSPQ